MLIILLSCISRYLLTTAMEYTDRVFQLQSEITAISPTNLAVTGGAKITITGTAFKIGTLTPNRIQAAVAQ